MLKVENLFSYYGRIEAIHGISFEVNDGEIVALIGSNGAGKTTILNSISGHIATKGSIRYNDLELTSLKPEKIARSGIIQVPEGRHVFPGLTVEQNLAIGTTARTGLRLKRGNIGGDIERIYDLFPRLRERSKQLAWSMSGGEQQMLVIGRALMGNPKLLLLDEPSMGLAPLVIDEVFEKIADINKAGTTVLLVEQNATRALQVSHRTYIIEHGRITHSGLSSELVNDERVISAYIGKKQVTQE